MTATLFLGFVAMMAAIVVGLVARYLNGRTAFRVLAGLSAWFIYAGLMGYFGVLKNTAMRPPGTAFLLVPVLFFLFLFIVRVLCQRTDHIGLSALDNSGCAMLPSWRRAVSASALDRRPRAQNADLRGRERGHLYRSVSTRDRLVVHARAIGLEARARLERIGPSRADERRDLRGADVSRPVQRDPRRSSQSDVRHVPIYVYPRILRALGGDAPRPCDTGDSQPATDGDWNKSGRGAARSDGLAASIGLNSAYEFFKSHVRRLLWSKRQEPRIKKLSKA